MPHWFLSTRTHAHGGPVAPVKVLDSDRPGHPYDIGLTMEFMDAIQGREVFFATHGFEVNQPTGIGSLNGWLDNLQIGSAVPVGIVWPGDCILPIFVDYVLEGRDAIQSGKQLASFINRNMTGAATVSFASHSLGARVVLQTIRGLNAGIRVRRVVLMAGAIDDNCLTGEYSDVTSRVAANGEISILASKQDDVLKIAYVLGNPIQGIIDRGHPYYHAALGRTGPASPLPASPPLRPNWLLPDVLNFGHHDYLPDPDPSKHQVPINGIFPATVDIPPDNCTAPPTYNPPVLPQPTPWEQAWAAAFASARYK